MTGNITIGAEDLGTSDPWEAITALRAERDKARDALAILAPIVQDGVLRMEAAAIEMRRGDAHAAMQWILNAMPDQWDGAPGTEWNGRETAREWFDRQPAVQREHARSNPAKQNGDQS